MNEELTNKPLIEAIFELKWKLQKFENGDQDPNKILAGMLYDKLKKDYPYFEKLAAADLPDEVAAYKVQNRFRVDKEKWPVVQIGPGIITVNDTENYKWEDFEKRIIEVVNILLDIYPNPKNLIFNSLLLRYIDSIDNFSTENNMFSFLEEKMHTKIELDEKLFEPKGVDINPLGIDFQTTFMSSKPKGAITLRFVRGDIENISKLVLETIFLSLEKDVPNDKDEIKQWLMEAHKLTDDWFFKLIEGDLYERFK